MKNISTVNCEGLSTTLTLLRIKQTLMASADQNIMSLKVSVGNMCDRQLLKQSLGQQANIVQFV